MYSNRIVGLKARLKYLEQLLESSKDKDALKTLLIDIYDVKSDIKKYSRLQWDEDHERVNFEDDR